MSAIVLPDAEMKIRHIGSVAAIGPDLLENWENDFYSLLGDTPRWEGLKLIVADQLAREKVGIIETGTCRTPGDWKGDGQSTRVWDWVLERKGGAGVSVDIDMGAVKTARKLSKNMHCVCQDSVSFLRGHWGFEPTLLYLDSRDYHPGEEALSCIHQVAELAAAWERLPAGCLIASDDSHDEDHGKPALTRRFLKNLSIEPIHDSYIVVWRKP